MQRRIQRRLLLLRRTPLIRRRRCDSLVEALKKKEYPAFVAAQVANDKLFRVQLGPFSEVKDAEAMRTRLVGDGYSPILKK